MILSKSQGGIESCGYFGSNESAGQNVPPDYYGVNQIKNENND